MFFRLTVDDDIELQLIEERHAPGLFSLVEDCRDYLATRLPWVPGITTVDDQRQFTRRVRKEFGEGRTVPLAMVYRGELCGVLSGHIGDRRAEIGYWLHRDNQGQGIVTRSCRLLIDYLFENYKIHRLVVRADPENPRSWKIPESLGFTHEGTLRDAGYLQDEFIDLRVYSLLRPEWQERS